MIEIKAAARLQAADKIDVVSMDVPTLIRVLEYAREELDSDEALHVFAEGLIRQSKDGIVTMKDYASVFASDWSAEVTDKVEDKDRPPEGTFKGSAGSIARALKKLHPDLKSAMSALNFYINRAGEDVPNKSNLEKAKDELRKLYT